MKIKKLNDEIMKITTTIHEKYPELERGLEELPQTLPDEKNPHITKKNLKEYRDTLATMVKNYEIFEKQKKPVTYETEH